MKNNPSLSLKLEPSPFTTAWVVLPEYTQWENRNNKFQWREDLSFEKAAESAFGFSWKKPISARPLPRPMGKGDFINVLTKEAGQWLKLASSVNGQRTWVWSDWEEVFGEEADIRKKIDKTILNLENGS